MRDAAVLHLMSRIFKTVGLSRLYAKLWNPINYFTIAGLGVGVNYVVFWICFGVLGWPVYVVNALAIGSAALWNWSQSVGPFAYLWGFKEKERII